MARDPICHGCPLTSPQHYIAPGDRDVGLRPHSEDQPAPTKEKGVEDCHALTSLWGESSPLSPQGPVPGGVVRLPEYPKYPVQECREPSQRITRIVEQVCDGAE